MNHNVEAYGGVVWPDLNTDKTPKAQTEVEPTYRS